LEDSNLCLNPPFTASSPSAALPWSERTPLLAPFPLNHHNLLTHSFEDALFSFSHSPSLRSPVPGSSSGSTGRPLLCPGSVERWRITRWVVLLQALVSSFRYTQLTQIFSFWEDLRPSSAWACLSWVWNPAGWREREVEAELEFEAARKGIEADRARLSFLSTNLGASRFYPRSETTFWKWSRRSVEL